MSLFSSDAHRIEDPFMRRAYELAERGRGSVSPNPVVGCVLVRDGVIVGEGYHARAGEDHAEVVALKTAGQKAEGTTAYVTLEPCNHFGKTPPCAPALVRAGVREVVIGMRDPNPAVTGNGAEALREAGVAVRFAEDSTPFERQNEAWLHRIRTGRPFVTVKIALSLDGKPALHVDKRAWITGAGGAKATMQLRSRSTAVAVGASTASIDDPLLTVRDDDGALVGRQRRRVILARTSVPSPRLAMLADKAAPVTLVVSERADPAALAAFERAGGTVVVYEYVSGIVGALRAIAAHGIDDVLVEAGPSLLTALHRARLVDRLVVITGGGFAGNAAPPAYLGPADAAGPDLDRPYRAEECATFDEDVAVVWAPRVHDQEGSL
ncbi:MAG: bifunctional diaminohydroxyphosphoribosylaminopyrimidine deaminase/5-amino-6-(5-phosphoribosylamino)uracil reductase RibD [Anaerosomatales bacterium]|nr:bifunctional diaminohydroxyphosphoribosylaminopyrimidine deaminase/5-amino-6-(5-phosphoribosylamino)uracil reductase RibD [Anaerosomatales bacterium]